MPENSFHQSTESELLTAVDEQDNVLGPRTKEECHRGGGILHRGFSIWIMNSRKQLLLQRRSAEKPLWPRYWSNSCCSHPRYREQTDIAAQRRLREELDLSAPLDLLYKFRYRARYRDVGTEHELCSVFTGSTDETARADPREVAEWRFVDRPELERMLAEQPEAFTPWFLLEWQEIHGNHLPSLFG